MVERTEAAAGVKRIIIAIIRTIEDVLNWKEKPSVSVTTPNELSIPTNFSSIAEQVIREIHLEFKQGLTVDFIHERLNLKNLKHFDLLNLFSGDEIPDPNSKIQIWGRASLFWFIKSIRFIYREKSHY